jgi:hypothetical protein
VAAAVVAQAEPEVAEQEMQEVPVVLELHQL